ncbi:acetoacetate-CoA ligase [Coniophora puteana RWD-64-598 SS2]|uniref:Acetoacetate-CoA ligase n=1 Tax=Coniophora puteana (strain RWD-64-598) TaxID=741705 RepID=A0A5M3MVM1_CONPW|nr:acetoacetate-CoA ligase [Coniophora puteana RWD-64-598 SS2]EIW83199.1 acetoacetate-CoA ligase [Coniophora puteana RWD-64-598 SS2]
MSSSLFEQSRLLWSPPAPSDAVVERLRREINLKHGLSLRNYHDLHDYSTTDYTFWRDLWDFLGIIASVPPSKILQKGVREEVPKWFPDARLNYAENLLHRNDDGLACTTGGELGRVSHYTFRQLRVLVQEMAAAMRTNGLQPGDRVAAIITNSITAVVIALATASVGAIFSSTATDMGTQGILDRYRQIKPKFVFSETEVIYAGKAISLVGKVSEVAKDLRALGLQSLVLLPSVRTGQQLPDALKIPNSVSLNAFLASGDNRSLVFEQLPFNHPLYILYSSGTSGPPKCIVHCAGGVLMNVKKDCMIGFGILPTDVFFQYTTTGWMMWPFMLTGLACGARIICYDGSPFHPDVRAYLKFINDQGVTVFGTSPRFLSEVQMRGINPLELGSFKSMRLMTVTGAVLTAPLMEWTHAAFGNELCIGSSSGGTDVCCAFVTTVNSFPLHAGELQGKSLGMAVEIFSPSGVNIAHTGEAGELVVTRPHPSIPIGFWGDDDGQKFRQAYYSTYPGIWRHGDFIAQNPITKGFLLLGRSDGVLNPSGVRFGSGEIYNILEHFSSELDDAICVGQRRPSDADERVLLFVKMREGRPFTEDLERVMKATIGKALSKRHVPEYIFEVKEIPYTVNGKKIEIAVKQIVSGVDTKPSGTVANPDSLKQYYQYRRIEEVARNTKKPNAKL